MTTDHFEADIANDANDDGDVIAVDVSEHFRTKNDVELFICESIMFL